MERGISAHAGDELYVLIYLNNGAADNAEQTSPGFGIARNVSVLTQADNTQGNIHEVKATASGSNIESLSGVARIITDSNERLELVPNSGEVFDYTGVHLLTSGFDMGNNTINIGDLQPHIAESLFIRFKLRVTKE